MLGLAVLFGLGLWIVITCGAIWLGIKLANKISSKSYAKYIGGALGFMLTMGGFIVYWTIEYYQIQARVKYLCETEGGLKIFVTPEQWRRKIGEEEWDTLFYVNDSVSRFDRLTLTFQDKEYYSSSQINPRIQALWADDTIDDGIGQLDIVYYDTVNKKVLVHETAYYVGVPAIANSLKGLKFWINEINDCPSSKLPEYLRFLVAREYTNISAIQDK